MDSPGHCAQYCTYTFMEMETKRILCIITMDKRMTEGKSTSLEKGCFEKGLKIMTDAGLNIKEVVTDAHPQIGALMSKYTRLNCTFINIKFNLLMNVMYQERIKESDLRQDN